MKKFFWAVFLLLVFLCSAGLIGYSWLVFQISRGVTAARHGELQTARASFELAETPFRTVPWLSRILKGDYEKLTFDQANVLFAQGEPEVIFDRFEEAVRSSPGDQRSGRLFLLDGRSAFSPRGGEPGRRRSSRLSEVGPRRVSEGLGRRSRGLGPEIQLRSHQTDFFPKGAGQ